MKLTPNSLWTKENENLLPSVIAYIIKDSHFLHVRFQVSEPKECFLASVEKDGGKMWEDSCVEIFVRALDAKNEYINFEFNSKGFCLAARGRNREHRQEFLPFQYAQILRTVTEPEISGNRISWELKVSIPAQLLGSHNLSLERLEGNLYKCGDRTERPHYLTLFPISTERPDFHQPLFFHHLA